jgi:multicomponent Na+:H+ antiporter subunit E
VTPLLPPILPRIVALAALWWVLAGDDPGSWWLGVPAIAAAAWIRRDAVPRGIGISPIGAILFVAYFLRGSVAGGVDVASRVVRPALPIAPTFVRHRLRQPEGHPARLLLLASISLLPGTLAAGVEGDTLVVHALDSRFAAPAVLAELEDRAGGVFGAPPARA